MDPTPRSMTRKIASEEQDESMADIEPPPLKIKTFQETIQSLENVQYFLDSEKKYMPAKYTA